MPDDAVAQTPDCENSDLCFFRKNTSVKFKTIENRPPGITFPAARYTHL